MYTYKHIYTYNIHMFLYYSFLNTEQSEKYFPMKQIDDTNTYVCWNVSLKGLKISDVITEKRYLQKNSLFV